MIDAAPPAEVALFNFVITPGCRGPLAGATITCNWLVRGLPQITPELETTLRKNAAALLPSDPLWGVGEADWPQALVLNGRAQEPSHWCVALAVAIQRWARDPVDAGAVLVRGDQTLLALHWHRVRVAHDALRLASLFIVRWLAPQTGPPVAELEKEFGAWLERAQAEGLTPAGMRFAYAAKARDIPVAVKFQNLWLGWGAGMERMNSSFSGRTSNIAVRIARKKTETSRILLEAGVPVPKTSLVFSWGDALKSAQKLGWPVVVKPADQEQGRGVVPGIEDEAGLQAAFTAAEQMTKSGVIVEQHVQGSDHRMLVVGGKLLAAARRDRAGVMGDGLRPITDLVEMVNADPRRGDNKSVLVRVNIDGEALDCLRHQGLAPGSVPAAGRWVYLRRTANISTGGTAVDVTDCVHPDNRIVAERAARVVGLDIAGVDFLCPDITRSWQEVGGAVCEVNAQPGLRPHWLGSPEHDVNGEIIDWLFSGKQPRIPTTAIATQGPSEAGRMLHHMFVTAGRLVGLCTREGVWIGKDRIVAGERPTFAGGQHLLQDPCVQAAVFEMQPSALELGHPCDRYDVTALLDAQAGRSASAAALNAQLMARTGSTIVVRADDSSSLDRMMSFPGGRRMMVVGDRSAASLSSHLQAGGDGVSIEIIDGAKSIVLLRGGLSIPVVPLDGIAFADRASPARESALLFPVAMAWAHGINRVTIANALRTYKKTE